jgi:hypothetical protein
MFGRGILCRLTLRAVAETVADDRLLIGRGARLGGAVADAVAEVSVLAEAGTIRRAVG